MKFYIKFTLIFLLITLFSQLLKGENNINGIYPTPGEISIVASTPIPPGVSSTRQSYLDLINCGFNLGMESGSLDYFKKEFSLLKGLNFKYLIQNGDITTSKRDIFINAFKDNENFAGWKFWDEPHYDDLESISQKYKSLFETYPNKLIYINLVGVTNKLFTGPFSTLPEYLEYFNQLIAPEIWSFDFYPILIRNGKLQVDYDTFFYDLETFSKISKKTNRPFWSYCETLAMGFVNNSVQYPAATIPYLRFEAFSALAYGAQGIVYWTYGQRKSNDKENYYSALVNLNGKKTSSWYAAQKVNNEIKRFNNVFYNCNVLEVRHTGDKLYKGTRKLSGEFGPIKMLRSREAGVLISRIENNGEYYIVIVNHDVFNKQKITIELKPNVIIEDITLPKTKQYSWRKDININLDKGGYILLHEYKN